MYATLYAIAEPISKTVKDRTREKIYLHLLSEIGELAEEINIFAGELYKEEGVDGITGETADMLNCMCDMAWMCRNILPDTFIEEVETTMAAMETQTTLKKARLAFIKATGGLPAISKMVRLRYTPAVAYTYAELMKTALDLAKLSNPEFDDVFLDIYKAKCAKWLEKAS